jgi:hypothetical protein
MAKQECTIDAYQEKVIKVACKGITPGEDMVVADVINSLRIGDCLVQAIDHMKIKVMNLSSQSSVVRRGQVVGQGEQVKCSDIFKVDKIMRKQPNLDKKEVKAVHGVTSGKKPLLPDKEVFQQTIRAHESNNEISRLCYETTSMCSPSIQTKWENVVSSSRIFN